MAKSKNLQLKGDGSKGASKCFNVTAPNDVSLCSQRSESNSGVPVPLFDLEQIQARRDDDGVDDTSGAVGPKTSFRLNSLYKNPPFPAGDILDEAVITGISPRFSPRIERCFSLQIVDDEGNEVGSIKVEQDSETREAIGAALDATRHSIFDSLCNDVDSDINNNEELNKVR